MSMIQSTNQCNFETPVEVLPPWAQDARERNAILADPRLQEYLQTVLGTVTDIQKFDNLEEGSKYYIVHIATPKFSAPLQVRVNVHYFITDPALIGPALFNLEFLFPALPV